MIATLQVDAMKPDDAPSLLRLARMWGEPTWHISPGAHGIVVREEGKVLSFGLLRETPYGFLIDELREEPTKRGIRALSILADWIEEKVQSIASERSTKTSLGGIVRLDNALHMEALKRRGYETVAHVLAKDFHP